MEAIPLGEKLERKMEWEINSIYLFSSRENIIITNDSCYIIVQIYFESYIFILVWTEK